MARTLIPLGTSGWMPTSTRETMCFAVETPEELVFFDLGTGVSRLSSQIGRDLLARHQRIIVLLSHYHLDHIAGLVYLPRFFIGKQVIIAGPGLGIYSESVEQILGRLCSRPFFALSPSQFPMQIIYQDLLPGSTRIGNLEVISRLQNHSDPSFGYRVSDVAYLTDTSCSIESTELCRGCAIMIHEAMMDAGEYALLPQNVDLAHSAVACVAELARAAGVKMLVLAHVNPVYSVERLAAMHQEATRIFPATVVAEDLVVIEQ